MGSLCPTFNIYFSPFGITWLTWVPLWADFGATLGRLWGSILQTLRYFFTTALCTNVCSCFCSFYAAPPIQRSTWRPRPALWGYGKSSFSMKKYCFLVCLSTFRKFTCAKRQGIGHFSDLIPKQRDCTGIVRETLQEGVLL